MTVVPPPDWYGGPWTAGVAYTPTDDIRDRLRSDREGLLEHAATRLRRHGLDVTTRLTEGRPASVIVETAHEIEADLVIVGARGHGAVEEALLGSVSAEVVDQASCAVLVARRPSAGRVLIGTDGSDVAISAAQFVARCGLFRMSQVRVVHAVDVNPTWWLGYTPTDANFALGAYTTVIAEGHLRGEEVTSSMASLLRADELAVTTVTVEGSAAAAIVDEAKSWRADVVVVGSRGNGLLKRLLLGSTTRSVMHHADASVLITRPMRSAVQEPAQGEDPGPTVPA
jgi:nucleotide-binding universal stress UspA family protein